MMPVLYGSPDDVRHAAAVSLGFGQGLTDQAAGSGAARPDTASHDFATPQIPDEQAVLAAETMLEAISKMVMAKEAERGG